MIGTILKVLVMLAFGVSIILTVPELFSPLAAIIDDIFDTTTVTVFQNIYSAIPEDWMRFFTVSLSVVAIAVLIRFVFK